MMKKLMLALSAFFLISSAVQAQKVYSTGGAEVNFSFLDGEYGNGSSSADGKLRFAPVINFYTTLHYDVSTNVGFTLGLGVNNVGFITDVPDSEKSDNINDGYYYNGDVSKRFRNYSVGIPVGFKIGIMEYTYLYGGYELMLPFLYKEKTYEDGEKVRKHTSWFNDETPTIYNSLFVGVQLPRGYNVKFQYYLDDFFDQEYVQETDNWTGARNYYPTKANVFYFTLSKTIFRGTQVVKYNKNGQIADPGVMASR